mgnify:CR=1 FL=1
MFNNAVFQKSIFTECIFPMRKSFVWENTQYIVTSRQTNQLLLKNRLWTVSSNNVVS